MNIRLLFKLLGILSVLIGLFMVASLPWCNPRIGFHTDRSILTERFESEGFRGLVYSSMICAIVGAVLLFLGRGATGKLFRKEAMAVVGLSWVLATLLGSLPFVFSGTYRGPSIRVFENAREAYVVAPGIRLWQSWLPLELDESQFQVLAAVARSNARGIEPDRLQRRCRSIDAELVFRELKQIDSVGRWLIAPGEAQRLAPADRASNYRIRWVRMNIFDAMFEAQSGFSTTGATVLSDLEDPFLVPRCILFWRASTHFLGGLGIIVLFVAILGQGSAGKAMMRAEVPGPSQDNVAARMQHTAWLFAGMYIGLNAVLAVILIAIGMSPMDGICHAFATMATGGFSTYNASLGHFASLPEISGAAIEYVVILFMVLAGTNFTLLALCLFGQADRLFADVEWRTYLAIILACTVAIVATGMIFGDQAFGSLADSVRIALFQVVSIVTTTGYGTSDFDNWNQLSRAILLLLMFVGGCAGSTGGGMKVIRHVMLVKILGIELERSFHPKVVRILRLGGKPVEDEQLRHAIVVYVALVVGLFAVGWLLVVSLEPDATWGANRANKLIDSASATAATLNNIGPGLGTVGPTQNYGHFGISSKAVFVVLMMLGRLEIFPILVLLLPRFWRDQ